MNSQRENQTLIRRTLLVGIFLFFFGAPTVLGDESANLSKALKSGKKEIQFSGKEKESVRIPKGVRVTGSSPDKAVITGDISMADGSSLKNVTVDGKTIAISIEKGATVSLENVTVTGASDAGIFAPKGGGILTVINSRVRQNRKGIFILSGKQLRMSATSVSNNQEEGLDMHAGTGGSITGSTFTNNKEGGIEVIINGGNFTLSGNTFSGNSASGLALQSYGGGGGMKTGKFILTGNTFSGNGNFGVDCKNPQGTGGAFFGASVKASGNIFSGNKRGSVNGECGIRNTASAEEVIDTEPADPEESAEEELQEEEQMNNLFEEAELKRVQFEVLEKEVTTLEDEIRLYKDKEKQRKSIRALFIRTPEQEIFEADFLERRDFLRGKVASCKRVDTYDVSIEVAEDQFLCNKEQWGDLIKRLETVTATIKKLTYQETLKARWQRFAQVFLPRLVW